MQAGAPDVRKRPLSGPAMHVVQVFKEIQALGHQVRLVAFYDNKIWKSEDLRIFEQVDVSWLNKGPVRWIERFVRRIQYEFRLPYAAAFDSVRFSQACCQILGGFDILYERMGWFGYGGGIASRRLKIPLLLEINGDHLSEFELLGIAPVGVQRRLSTSLMHWTTRQAVHVVATGEGWKQRYCDRWGGDSNRVSVVENGSDYVTALKREQLRSFNSHDELQEPIVILYLGAFEPWHGISFLLKAAAKAISNDICIHLILAGKGSEEEKIREEIKHLGLINNVSFTGHLPPEKLYSYLSRADIGVSPYFGRVEYSGLKLLDYKAAGLAIIASGENGQPSVIEHGRTGLIVTPGDVGALFQAIVKLSLDAETRKRMGREARIEAEKKHSWRVTAENLETIFHQTLQKCEKLRQ
jgi:glycosyltransferase involved in cell wall biosynthesis